MCNGRLHSSVDLAAVAGIDSDDREHRVLDTVENTIVTASHAPFGPGGELLRRRWSCVLGKELDHRLHATLRLRGKLAN